MAVTACTKKLNAKAPIISTIEEAGTDISHGIAMNLCGKTILSRVKRFYAAVRLNYFFDSHRRMAVFFTLPQ